MTELKGQECLYNEPEGFILKIFLAASRVTSKSFRLAGHITPLGQTLKISNIAAKELEIWLCTNKHNRIIVNICKYRQTQLLLFRPYGDNPPQFQFS